MKMFINFDKDEQNLNINYYLEEHKAVIKTPLVDVDETPVQAKITRFHIENTIYLTNFD